MELVVEVQTLTLQQLSQRANWEKYSLDNIYQFAQDGHIGLYCNISQITGSSKMRNYANTDEYLEKLISYPNLPDEERNNYIRHREKYTVFLQCSSHLLKHIDGFARLATNIETEIFHPYASHASVDKLRRDLILRGAKHGDFFGCQLINGEVIVPTYWLLNCNITSENIFVMLEHIKIFEQLHFDRNKSTANEQDDRRTKANSIILNGHSFQILFNYKELPNFKELFGLHILKVLLQNPHKSLTVEEIYLQCNPKVVEPVISAEELYGGGLNISQNTGMPEMAFDDQTKQTVLKKLEEITEDLVEAQNSGDYDNISILEEQQKKLKKYLNEGTYKGKIKKSYGDARKKYDSILKAIKLAKEAISVHSPELEKHITSYLTTGFTCKYSPPHDMNW